MTFRERLKIDCPSATNLGGCGGCPSSFGYEPSESAAHCKHFSCLECWDREMESEEEQMHKENVNHPDHYNHGMECFDEFERFFGTKALLVACLFNIWKYRKRAVFKNGAEDMDKSDVYVQKSLYCKEKIGTADEIIGVLSFQSEFPFM